MDTYLVYRHIRPDKDEVFYVGKGLEGSKRQISIKNRNKHWHNIVSKNVGNYDVDIIMSGLTNEEACEKEIEFIKLYGRRDLGEGTLCNFTNGGEGVSGMKHSEDTKLILSEANKGKVVSESVRKKISDSMKGIEHSKESIIKMSKSKTGKNPKGKSVLNTVTNKMYNSIRLASIDIGVNYNTLFYNLRKGTGKFNLVLVHNIID